MSSLNNAWKETLKLLDTTHKKQKWSNIERDIFTCDSGDFLYLFHYTIKLTIPLVLSLSKKSCVMFYFLKAVKI